MGDLAWYIFICVLLVLLGSIFSGLGLSIWLRQNTELIIRTHCEKVSEKNKPAYCRLMGIGMLAIGAGMILSGFCTAFAHSLLVFLPMAAGLAAGIFLMALAVFRYNR